MTFEDITRANKEIRLVDIKGKLYAPVSERVKAFRMVYPMGRIETEVVSMENGTVLIRANAYAAQNALLATGYAYEKENSSYINKTSFIENAETSAVGRALGFAGFGIDTEVASAEEVANADLQDDSKQTIDEATQKAILARCHAEDVPLQTILDCAKIKSLGQMTNKQHMNLMEKWEIIKTASKARGGEHE